MKKILILIILLFQLSSFAQTVEDAWIFLQDKPQQATYLSNPLSMLSQRALDRRARYNIALDEKDVPIDDNYISQIRQSAGISIKAKSKWLNALHVQGLETDIRNLLSFNFVERIEFANKNIGIVSRPTSVNKVINNFKILNSTTTYNYQQQTNQINMLPGDKLRVRGFTGQGVLIGITDTGFQQIDTDPLFEYLKMNNKTIDVSNFRTLNTTTTYNYGQGANQINMLHGDELHVRGFTGQGVLIGIIDAGFQQVDTDPLFEHLRMNNKIIDVYNFVGNDTNIYQYHMHGSGVLSTIGANTDGVLVGTAPDALFALYVSEDASQEMPIEESYWAQAAERADSVGVDVINTSLGYMRFDRADYNYTMSDLDGNTAFISRAAEIAVSRGINVVVSAGNSGTTDWPKIGFPADAVSVITVGAVDEDRLIANFSSRGNTTDGRVKPDIMAQGKNASVFWNGNISSLNGTSFSSPIIAGMVGCLVQIAPNTNPYQLKQSILETADNYATPNENFGYGIPDFSQNALLSIDEFKQQKITIFPNPTSNFININYLTHPTNYILTDLSGKIILKGVTTRKIMLKNINTGIYLLQIKNKYFKIIKYE